MKGLIIGYHLTGHLVNKSLTIMLNPDFAVDFVARCSKPQRNAQLERFCDEGIIIIMLRNKIVSQTTTRATGSYHT